MADVRQAAANLAERYRSASSAVRIGVGVFALTFVGLLAFVANQSSTPTMGVLFSNLSQDDTQRVTERLRTAGVPYEMDEQSGAILVPESRVHDVRLMLSSEGLPVGGGTGFELFDEQRFGESEFIEQVKYHRALEGELARTISHLAGVRRARVHLVLPTRTLFQTAEQKASASVVLHLQPGFRMREEQAQGIIHLVASSVRGLESERVTIIDGQGRPLGKPDKGLEQTASDALSYRQQVEHSRQLAAQQLLDRTLGRGKAVVRVAADVDFSREERTEEVYDPKGVAPRSFQIEQESAGRGGRLSAGVPGAPSNLPGAEAPESSKVDGDLVRRSETRNFEVSKVTRHAIEPVGRIKGLQVAVVVDGKWAGEGDARKFTPLPKEELDRISAIVSRAVGIDAERGDSISVECISFAPETVPVDDRPAIEVYAERYGSYVKYGMIALGILIGVIVLLIALLQLRRRLRAHATVVEEQRLESGDDPSLSLGSGELRAQAELAAAQAEEQDAEAEELRTLAAEIANAQPDVTARVVRAWLQEDTR